MKIFLGNQAVFLFLKQITILKAASSNAIYIAASLIFKEKPEVQLFSKPPSTEYLNIKNPDFWWRYHGFSAFTFKESRTFGEELRFN